MRRLRVYADTSVFGGCFDEEFEVESRSFFRSVDRGIFILGVSYLTLRELALAPEPVRRVLGDVNPSAIEMIKQSDEIRALRNAYINAGVLTISSLADAEHIAAASVSGLDLVVSWNFKHIVHYD